MKNVKKVLILALVLSALMCVSVFAGDTTIAEVKLTSGTLITDNGAKDQVQFRMSYPGTDGQMYLLMVLNNTLGEGKAPEAKDILYVNQETVKEDGKATFATVYPTEIKDSVIYLAGGNLGKLTQIGTIKANGPVGVTVSGQVTSYNGKNDVKVQLKKGNDVAYEKVISGTGASGQITQAFSIETVAEGTYDLVVTKGAHLTYTITGVTVGKTALALSNDIIMLAGDVNNDDSINESDVSIIRLSGNINKAVEVAANVAADVNGDGSVNESDVSIIRLSHHINKGVANCTYEYGK